MEGQTEGLVDLLATLAAIEQVLLDVVADSEELAARCVGSGVHAVGASDTASERAWEMRRYQYDVIGGGVRFVAHRLRPGW